MILGLFTLVLGALILPLFGLSLGSLFGAESTGSGYGSQYGHSEPSYGPGHIVHSTKFLDALASLELVLSLLNSVRQVFSGIQFMRYLDFELVR